MRSGKKSTDLLENISNPRFQNVARLESEHLWNLQWLMQDTWVWFSLDVVPKQVVTSIKKKKKSWAILPCHVDNGPVGCIFQSFTRYFGSITWWQFGCVSDEVMVCVCVWYVRPKAQFFDEALSQKLWGLSGVQTSCPHGTLRFLYIPLESYGSTNHEIT